MPQTLYTCQARARNAYRSECSTAARYTPWVTAYETLVADSTTRRISVWQSTYRALERDVARVLARQFATE